MHEPNLEQLNSYSLKLLQYLADSHKKIGTRYIKVDFSDKENFETHKKQKFY